MIPDLDKSQSELQLSLFHSVFNVTNTLLMLGFIPLIAKFVTKIVPSRGIEDEAYNLEYIGTGAMVTTEASILEAKKELLKFAKLATKMTTFVSDLLVETDGKQFKKSLNRIKKYEEITDKIESEIVDYLARVSEGELSELASRQMRARLSIANDLESIGDINYSMARIIKRKAEDKIYFVPHQRENLLEMFSLLEVSMEIMLENLDNDLQGSQLEKAYQAEKAINKKRNELKKAHLESIEKGEYKYESGMIYTDIFSAVESVGDRVMSVSEASTGKIS
jgi:phosphate:Na+ symporter